MREKKNEKGSQVKLYSTSLGRAARMYETIAYVPTIMAYAFVFLLIMILAFIVIYIAHKIYTYIYDYMPLPHLSSAKFQKRFRSRRMHVTHEIQQILESQLQWSPNTALRILVNVRPCYLASVVYEIDENPYNESRMAMTTPINSNVQRLTRYFDSLSVIPTEPHILHCYNDGSPTITYLASGEVMIES